MNTVELYIKEKGINISELERKMDLPSGSIRITGRGIPLKHLEGVENLLESEYGYIKSPVVLIDEPSKEVVIKKMYNEGRVPEWRDGILRFRDPDNGLWRRYKDWCESVDEKTGEIRYRKGFEKATEEVFEDNIGKYTLCINGIKVYKFEK